MTEVPTGEGTLRVATVIDLYSRRLLAAATSTHPDAPLACAALRMAVAVRGGKQAIAAHDESAKVIPVTLFVVLDAGAAGHWDWYD